MTIGCIVRLISDAWIPSSRGRLGHVIAINKSDGLCRYEIMLYKHGGIIYADDSEVEEIHINTRLEKIIYGIPT